MRIDDEIKGRFRNEHHRAIINLTYTASQLSYKFMQKFKAHKLSEPQYNVLRVLRGNRNLGPVSIGFLKERMLDKNSDVSRIVDKLFEQGFVNRTENNSDRRVKDVEITQKGLDLINEMRELIEFEDNMLKNLTEDEVIELNRLLDKIRE